MKRPELWLSFAFNAQLGAYIAIASRKHPVLGDSEVDVVAHSFEVYEEGCRRWFDCLCESRRPAISTTNTRSDVGNR